MSMQPIWLMIRISSGEGGSPRRCWNRARIDCWVCWTSLSAMAIWPKVRIVLCDTKDVCLNKVNKKIESQVDRVQSQAAVHLLCEGQHEQQTSGVRATLQFALEKEDQAYPDDSTSNESGWTKIHSKERGERTESEEKNENLWRTISLTINFRIFLC